MKKILVPTDLSANSKAGIRFAIQLSAQSKASLVFFYCLPFLKPTSWSDARYDAYMEKETEDSRKSALAFIRNTYGKSGVAKSKIECIVRQSPDAGKAIIDYAKEIHASAICMSTRGAGRLKKLLGNHASEIITNSPIPAYVIPKNYRRTPIRHILYSSDLNNVGKELKQVKAIAKELKAKLSVLHYDYLADVPEARKKLDAVANRYKSPGLEFHFEKLDLSKPLSQQLLKDFSRYKASVAILFTNQKRGWFDKLFLSSKSKEVAYDSRVPLLVFPKNS